MKFIPCRTCRSDKAPPGYILTKSHQGYDQYKECACHEKWRQDNETFLKLKASGFADRDLEYNPNKDYLGKKSLHEIEKLRMIVANFQPFKSEAFYLYGINGSQKTTLAKWCGANLIAKGVKVQYVLMQTLVKILTILDDDERDAKVKKYIDCDMLILDEVFDKNKITLYKSNYQIPFLDQFIRDRLDNYKRSIMFISNKRVDEIDKEGFGFSLQDLIQRKVILKKTLMVFEDRYFNEVNMNSIKGVFD